jgi:hypothetical protein
MKPKTILFFVILAVIAYLGLPIFGMWFDKYRAESALDDEMADLAAPDVERMKKMAALIVERYELPVDIGNVDQFGVAFDEGTKTLSLDMVYSVEINYRIKIWAYPKPMEIHIERSWK